MDLESKLIIAIISAGSAITGAVISQFISLLRDFLDKRHQRKILLRTKYEDFANFVTESQEWVSSLYRLKSLEEYSNNPPTQARKAMLLAYIYFPLLIEQSEKYMNSCATVQRLMVENFRTKDSAPLEKPVKELARNRQELDRLIIKYANTYSKA